MDGLLAAIDIYCEREGPNLLAEPFNAVTNLAFVAAGAWGLREALRRHAGGFAILLCWWVIAIGIGSALFHIFANHITMWADILPIAGFTLAYTIFNLRHFMRLGWPAAIAATLVFYCVAGLITAAVPSWLVAASNGSTGYLPALLALVFFGALLLRKGHPAGRYNLMAAGIFVVSVFFRAVDMEVCRQFPIGTHFMWHLLNGLMLGVLLAATTRFASTQIPLSRAG